MVDKGTLLVATMSAALPCNSVPAFPQASIPGVSAHTKCSNCVDVSAYQGSNAQGRTLLALPHESLLSALLRLCLAAGHQKSCLGC